MPIEEFKIDPEKAAWMRTIPFDLVVSIGNGSFINLTVDWNDTSYDTYSTENETPPFNVCPADSVSRSVT